MAFVHVSYLTTGTAVIVTDGNCCTEEELKEISAEMQADGLTVIAVGFGDTIVDAKLRAIASSKELVFTATDTTELLQVFIDALSKVGALTSVSDLMCQVCADGTLQVGQM